MSDKEKSPHRGGPHHISQQQGSSPHGIPKSSPVHPTTKQGSAHQKTPHHSGATNQGPPHHNTPTQGSPRQGSPHHTGPHKGLAHQDSQHISSLQGSVHSDHESSEDGSEPTEAEIWEKEKQELKSKISELEAFKDKYENEKKENQLLQNRLSELMTGQSDAMQRLVQTSDALDRLKLDHGKKVEQIEKMQRDISFKDDRIRNLEIRASEVEKAELILETTKTNLESTVTQVRAREGEIRKLNKDIDDLTRQLELANAKIKESEVKANDLKLQVRHELLKNDNIEKNLETIPRLKDTISERDGVIRDQQRQLEEKTALLSAARRAVREYKDRLRVVEREISKTYELKHDLDLSQCEVMTLKKLMYGKDYLVSQKSRALDLSKEIIEVLNDSVSTEQVQRIHQLLDRVATPTPNTHHSSNMASSTSSSCRNGSFSYPSDSESRPQSTTPRMRCSTPSPAYQREISVNSHPYSMEDGHRQQQNGKEKHVKVVVETPGKRKRPISACVPGSRPKSSIHRTSSLREAHKVYTQHLPRKSNNFEVEIVQISNGYKTDKDRDVKQRSASEYKAGLLDEEEHEDKSLEVKDTVNQELVISDSESEHSDDTDYEGEITREQEELLRGFTAKEKDAFMVDIINVGDRVLFKRNQKPPRYGKKRAMKPLIHTGIVKFKGKFDKEKYDARIHVGVRMDEPVGDTDGTVNGKRYMYTPADQGKFFKMREITSVLNVKTGRYVPMKKVLVHHILRIRHSKEHHKSTAEAH